MDGTMVSVMSNLIAALRTPEVVEAVPGQLMDRGRAIDHLLDLRLEADTNPVLTELLDGLLADVPGKTVVELVWWRDTLDRVAEHTDYQPTA